MAGARSSAVVLLEADQGERPRPPALQPRLMDQRVLADRLIGAISDDLAAAAEDSRQSSQPARHFKELLWTTQKSWSRRRRVVAKAEWTHGEANPRFVVTSLTPEEHAARPLYEDLYCARGDMENRITECQMALFADRTSAATMKANQLWLWFASMA